MNLLIVNFKQYEVSTGINSIGMIKALSSGLGGTKLQIMYAVSSTDLLACREKFGDSIMAQHFDPVPSGPHTGQVSYNTLSNMGIKYSLLNHSEHRISYDQILASVNAARSRQLEVVLCAASMEEVKEFAALDVNYIAYEPPELIGGDISVSTSKPDIVREAASICSSNGKRLLVGAGVKTEEDARAAVLLGASGILVSSGVVLARSPGTALSSLAKALS